MFGRLQSSSGKGRCQYTRLGSPPGPDSQRSTGKMSDAFTLLCSNRSINRTGSGSNIQVHYPSLQDRRSPTWSTLSNIISDPQSSFPTPPNLSFITKDSFPNPPNFALNTYTTDSTKMGGIRNGSSDTALPNNHTTIRQSMSV